DRPQLFRVPSLQLLIEHRVVATRACTSLERPVRTRDTGVQTLEHGASAVVCWQRLDELAQRVAQAPAVSAEAELRTERSIDHEDDPSGVSAPLLEGGSSPTRTRHGGGTAPGARLSTSRAEAS